MKFTEKKQEIKEYIIDNIDDYEGIQAEELHNELFNTSYWIVYRHDAIRWLSVNDDTFEAIQYIKEYEQDNFDEVNTDFSSPEDIANMLAYILGDEVLAEVYDQLEGELTYEKIGDIKKRLK